jgi:CheY-like chemotaxis protein
MRLLEMREATGHAGLIMATILVIDDDAMFRNMVVAILDSAGHSVTEIDNAGDGLKLIRTSPPDLVITDIIMPGKDGIETVIELRRDFPKLPVIAMSGNSALSPLYLKMAKQLGAVQILGKPFTIEVLSKAVDEALKVGG